MIEHELISRVNGLLGKSYEEVPCWKMLPLLTDSFPPAKFVPVEANYLQVGDFVAFGDDASDSDTTIGIYLGNGKLVVSLPGHGVRLIPFRFVREKFLWGGRCGQ